MAQSIPPDVYDREYFLSEICEGFEEFQQNQGVSLQQGKQVTPARPAARA